jgi:hypothetical protein
LECSPASQKLVTKHPDAMSHVLLLHDWKPRISADDEKELLREVESGLTYQALREEVEKRADALEAKSDAQRAPDRETASRRSTHARTGGGNVSRGREVKGADAREARREAEGALATAGQYIETARGWMESLSEDERQKLSGKYAFALRRRLKEIFPEIP